MMRVCAGIACCTLVCWGFVVSSIAAQPSDTRDGLTAIAGIRVGHYTLDRRPTGCTVVLTEAGAVATVDVRGAAPGTRETALLDPVNTVQQVHAIVLSGGSAFGLAAADGVMRYLEERKVGYRTRAANVPIVPAAILYDLGIGDDPTIHPTAECGYQAALAATNGPVAEGSIGGGNRGYRREDRRAWPRNERRYRHGHAGPWEWCSGCSADGRQFGGKHR